MPRSRITADDLRLWCAEQSHAVTVDDAVYEPVAALILDRSPGTVANWRANGGAAARLRDRGYTWTRIGEGLGLKRDAGRKRPPVL